MNKSVITIFLSLLIIFQTTHSQNAESKDFIFVIDQSSSMNKNSLFEKVKQALDLKLTEKINEGDRVTILGFDSDVRIITKKKISNVNDRFEIQGIVNKLEAKGDWTYITRALEITAQELEQIKESGNPLKLVYLMTDGHNDPPPSIKNPTTYQSLLDKYFNTWTQENTFITFIRFGVEGNDKEQEEFVNNANIETEDIDPDTVQSPEDFIPDNKIKEDTTVVGPSINGDDVKEDQESSFKISSELIYLILILLIIILAFLVCKFLMPKFPVNMELIINDKISKRNEGSYNLSEFNKFCITSTSIGESKDIDVDLDGTILTLKPTKGGIKVSVNNGEVWQDFETEDNLHSEGDSFLVIGISEIITSSKNLKINIEDDNLDDEVGEDDLEKDKNEEEI